MDCQEFFSIMQLCNSYPCLFTFPMLHYRKANDFYWFLTSFTASAVSYGSIGLYLLKSCFYYQPFNFIAGGKEKGTPPAQRRNLIRALLPHSQEAVAMFINMEAQTHYYPGYPLVKRGIYYCCRMISAQYGAVFADSHYEKIRKVYSVWVCTTPPKYLQNTISSYEITKKDMVGIVEEPLEHYDLLSMIMLRLNTDSHPEASSNELLGMLSTLFSQKLPVETKKCILENQFHIPMTKEIKEEIHLMCDYGDGIMRLALQEGMQKGMQEGLEKGLQQGIEQGMEQGIKQGTFSILCDLLKDGFINLEEAAQRMNLSVAEFQSKMQKA